nr:hypothetical protein [Tanacetum cinerariifolium]
MSLVGIVGDYDYEIPDHPGKANIILEAQTEERKPKNLKSEDVREVVLEGFGYLVGYEHGIPSGVRWTERKNHSDIRRYVARLHDETLGMGEGSTIPTEPHHTPSPHEQQSPHYDPSSPSHLTATTIPIPTLTPTEIPTLRQYSRRATWIAQSKALPTAADKPASLLRDDSQGEAFSTELMDLCTGLQRQQTEMASKINAQDLEISSLKARIKLLEDKDRGNAEPSGDDALIKGGMVNVLTSMEAANILTSGVAAVSVPSVAGVSAGCVLTVSAIFTTASMVTPHLRRPRGISAKDKGKEKVVESDTPKKKKLQEQIDAKVAREMEEEIAREDQRMNEQLARDAEIARIHAEKS